MGEVSVVLTGSAADALRRVRESRGDDLSLVIGNGCCDSTAPFLFARYAAGGGETRVAEVDGVPVFLDTALLDLFAGREIVIDAREGADDSFSAETEHGVRLTVDRLPAATC